MTVLKKVFPKARPNKAMKVCAILDGQSNTTLGNLSSLRCAGLADDKFEYTLSSCDGKVQLSARPQKQRSYIPELDKSSEISFLVYRDLPEVQHLKGQDIGLKQTPFAQELAIECLIIGEVCLGIFHSSRNIQVSKTYLSTDTRPTIPSLCENTLNINEINFLNYIFSTKSSIFVRTKDGDKIDISVDDRKCLKTMAMWPSTTGGILSVVIRISLTSVLQTSFLESSQSLRFLRDRIAVIADIEQKFYIFYVKEDHNDFLARCKIFMASQQQPRR